MARILIVDDNPSIRHLLRVMLSRQYELLYAANGVEGLNLFRIYHPDLVLLDRSMPAMDGPSLAHAIRYAKPAQPMVMMTGAAECEPPPGVPLLRKPFRLVDLLWAVADALNQKRDLVASPETASAGGAA